jgi:hypothetical protein
MFPSALRDRVHGRARDDHAVCLEQPLRLAEPEEAVRDRRIREQVVDGARADVVEATPLVNEGEKSPRPCERGPSFTSAIPSYLPKRYDAWQAPHAFGMTASQVAAPA